MLFKNTFSRMTVDDKFSSFKEKTIVFRQLETNDIIPLMKAGFPHKKSRLKQSLPDRFFQRIGFKPLINGLVAYHTQEKQTIGFLQLNKHSKWLYSIKFAFTNPNFRRKGIGSNLFNFAFSQARNKGARKIFLNVDPYEASSIGLYRKLGFELISKSYEVWARIVLPKNILRDERYLNSINLDSSPAKVALFDICKKCINNELLDFFEVKYSTLLNGFSGDFRHLYFKSAFTNNNKTSFALVFKRPMLKNLFVELFVSNDSEVPHMFDGLIHAFKGQGINEISLRMFNIKDESCIQLIKKRGFYVYHSLSMGKCLCKY